MYFEQSGERMRIDYVLVYKKNAKKPEYEATRDIYEQNLRDYGLIVCHSPEPVSWCRDEVSDRIQMALHVI